MIAQSLPNTPCLLHQNLKCHECDGKEDGHADLEYDNKITVSPFKFAAWLLEKNAQSAYNCTQRCVKKKVVSLPPGKVKG